MEYWTWWASGLALSAVMVFHWFALHRMMAVSGRITSLVDRIRHGAPEPSPLSPDEMLAAIQATTAEEFGEGHIATKQTSPPASSPKEQATTAPPPRTSAEHILFFFGLVCGGAVAAWFGAGFSPTLSLHGSAFSRLSGESPTASFFLLGLGGLLVGFGTRMAGGCTSGHGLCGSSRLQPGSLVATLSFFGMGILVSFGLQVLM